MKTEYTGIYLNGGVSFDAPLNLPENTRVVVTVAENELKADTASTFNSQRIALLEFLELSKKLAKPLHDHHYTRDELYDRY